MKVQELEVTLEPSHALGGRPVGMAQQVRQAKQRAEARRKAERQAEAVWDRPMRAQEAEEHRRAESEARLGGSWV